MLAGGVARCSRVIKRLFKSPQTLLKCTFPRGNAPLTWSGWCISDDRLIRFHEILENAWFSWKSLTSLGTSSSSMAGCTSTSCTSYAKKTQKTMKLSVTKLVSSRKLPGNSSEHLTKPPASIPLASEPIYSYLHYFPWNSSFFKNNDTLAVDSCPNLKWRLKCVKNRHLQILTINLKTWDLDNNLKSLQIRREHTWARFLFLPKKNRVSLR